MMTLDNRVRRPFWREPMVWLVASIPVAAIIGTLWMVYAASIAPGNDDATADPVRRTAQVQEADLGPDARAATLHLSAIVRTGKGAVEVIPVEGDFDRGAPLTLALRHPARADGDRMLTLAPTDTGWRARLDDDGNHDWNVQLQPRDGAWRLQARWPARQQAAYLKPALRGADTPQ